MSANTMTTKKLEVRKDFDNKIISLYACGITVREFKAIGQAMLQIARHGASVSVLDAPAIYAVSISKAELR